MNWKIFFSRPADTVDAPSESPLWLERCRSFFWAGLTVEGVKTRLALALILLVAGWLVPAIWAQPNPVRITSITPANGQVVIQWEGGAAPCQYQLQRRTSVTSAWQDIGGLTSAFSATNSMTANSAFYRIMCVTNSSSSSLPPSLQLAGFLPALGVARDVCASGGYAFVAADKFGLSAVNVTIPGAPAVVGSANVPFDGAHVALSGSLACVTGSRSFHSVSGALTTLNGFYIYDVADPAKPTLRGRYETNTLGFSGLAVSGNYAYVACGTAGIKVIDISNPALPVIVGGYDTIGWANSVCVAGNFAYVADGTQGLRILSLSNPRTPVNAGWIDTPGNAKQVCVAGTTAYVADNTYLQIIDVASPAAPVIRGSLAVAALEVKVQGTVAYVAGNGTGLTIVNVINPATPVQVGILPPTGNPNAATVGVFPAGAVAYVANYVGGLAIANIATPATPAVSGKVAEWFNGYKLATKPGMAVVTGTHYWDGGAQSISGLKILNTTDAAAPVVIGQLESTLLSFLGVALSGNYAYLATGGAGLRVINVGNPASPAIVGTYDTPGWANAVTVSGNLAYVADGAQGLRIINVSNPQSPVSVGWVDTPGSAKDVAIEGTLAYVADNTSVRIIDVSNPAAPFLRGSLSVPALEVKVQNGLAYVAASGLGLIILDVSNPATPVQIGSLPPSGHPNATTLGVAVVGNLAFLANHVGGLAVVDVAVPSQPVLRNSVLTVGTAYGVICDNNWVCLSDTLGSINTVWLGQ